MPARYSRLSVLAAVLVAGTACREVPTATQMYQDQMDQTRWASRPYLVYMADNAMLQDMAIADFHFVAHTAELSGTGVARLDRMAALLSTYGGTVRYETHPADEGLVERRLEHVREYLAMVGCDMERVEVKAMISGGRGMPAGEAIEIDERGTAKSQAASGTGSTLLNLGTASGG